MTYIYYSLFRCFPSNKCSSINVYNTNRREKQMNDNFFFFFFGLVQKRCGKKNLTQLSCLFLSSLPPTRPKDAMRALKKRLCGNKNYREVMLALTVRRCEAGDAGSLHAELPHAWTPSSPSPPPLSLCRFWKRAWKTAATGFTSTWPTGTSWMECWSRSSPPRTTLQQSSRTKCSRSYRSDSKYKSVMVTTVIYLIRYVVRLLCGRLGPTPSEAAPIWPVWSTFTRNWKGKVLSSRWRIWMRCHPFTRHRGWEENKHKDLTTLNFTKQYPCPYGGAFNS